MSRLEDLEEEYRQTVTCAVCQDIFTEPKTLSCLHVFCLTCLDNWMKQSPETQFPCPTCSEICDKPKDGAKAFKTNFHMNSMVDVLARILKKSSDVSKSLCVLCLEDGDEEEAVSHCLDCDKRLCKGCKKYHMKFHGANRHKMINLSGDVYEDAKATLDVLSERRQYCEKHPEEQLKLYCKADNMTVCQLCYITEHQGHKCLTLEDAAKVELQKADDLANLHQGSLKQYNESIEDVNAYMNDLKKRRGELAKAISDDRQHLHKRIDELHDEVLKNLDRITDGATKTALAHLNDVEMNKGIAESSINQIGTMKKFSTSAEIMGLSTNIQEKLAKWTTRDVNYNEKISINFERPHINLEDATCKITSSRLATVVYLVVKE